MFSGIIEKTGTVQKAEFGADFLRLRLSTGFQDLALGESVAVNGVCLTVAELGPNSDEALFFLSPETLDRTSLGRETRHGQRLNLERALRLDARLSGHMVQGHVDGVGELLEVQPIGESHRIKIGIPDSLSRYCVEKGSICLHGISLTINRLSEPRETPSWIELMIIPHTWTHTTLRDLHVGDRMNVEVDVLAKYAERLCQNYLKP